MILREVRWMDGEYLDDGDRIILPEEKGESAYYLSS
jgi:hypothetical protein